MMIKLIDETDIYFIYFLTYNQKQADIVYFNYHFIYQINKNSNNNTKIIKTQKNKRTNPNLKQIKKQQNMIHTTTDGQQFKEYSYRIVISLLYAAATMINGMCWVVVTPISQPIQKAYGISAAWVAFIPMSYLIFFVILNFPSNWVIDVKGIKKGVVIGAALTFLGCLIRCLVRVGFAFVIIGQVFCSIAQPFILNASMKIATRWFMPKNRSLAMALLTVMNIIGTAVGFIIPSLFVDQKDTVDNIKDHFFVLLLVEAIISAIVALLIIIFFKESPPTLPSLGSMAQSIDFKKSIGMLFKDKRFMSLALAFGTVNGTFNIYGSLMDDILDPYGFNSDQVSAFGAALMITGIISAALFGIYVEKTLKYRNTFIACSIIGLATTALFPLALKFWSGDAEKYYWFYMALVVCQGIVFIPLQPLTIDYASDTMFPIGEAQITGFMLSVGQIFGIIFIEVAQLGFKLGDDDLSLEDSQAASFNSVLFSNAFLAVGCVTLILQNRELKRSKYQREKKDQDGSLIVSDNSSILLSKT